MNTICWYSMAMCIFMQVSVLNAMEQRTSPAIAETTKLLLQAEEVEWSTFCAAIAKCATPVNDPVKINETIEKKQVLLLEAEDKEWNDFSAKWYKRCESIFVDGSLCYGVKNQRSQGSLIRLFSGIAILQAPQTQREDFDRNNLRKKTSKRYYQSWTPRRR